MFLGCFKNGVNVICDEMAFRAANQSVVRHRDERSSLLQYANMNRMAGYFNDVTIDIMNQKFPANRMVLACYSQYFDSMFKIEMQERYAAVVNLPGVQADVFATLLEFMYTGAITINRANAWDLLAAADYLQMNDLRQFCFEFVESQLSIECWNDVLRASYLYNSDATKHKVFNFISCNLNAIAQDETLKNFSSTDFVEFLTSLDRDLAKERAVYDVIITWTYHDATARKAHFDEIFQFLNLMSLSSSFLEDVVSSEPLVKESLFCSNSVMEVMKKLLKEKRMKDNGSKIISLGGCESGSVVVEVYNFHDSFATTYPNLPHIVDALCCVKLNKNIYSIGGTSNGGSTNETWQLKVNDGLMAWSKVASMWSKRSEMGAVAWDDGIVVAGGFDGQEVLRSVECYNALINEWRVMKAMQERRSGHALVQCGDGLLAVGGFDGNVSLKSAERFSRSDQRWSSVPSMTSSRNWLAAVSCRDCVYAIGGRAGPDEMTTLRSVEKYSPVEQRWRFVNNLNVERSELAACVLEGRIYVVGGRNARGEPVREIECYDPSLDVWSVVGEANSNFYFHSVIAV